MRGRWHTIFILDFSYGLTTSLVKRLAVVVWGCKKHLVLQKAMQFELLLNDMWPGTGRGEENKCSLGWLCGCHPFPCLELTEPFGAHRIFFFLFENLSLFPPHVVPDRLLETFICGLSILLLTLISLLHNHKRNSVAIWNVNELLAWPIAICSSVWIWCVCVCV